MSRRTALSLVLACWLVGAAPAAHAQDAAPPDPNVDPAVAAAQAAVREEAALRAAVRAAADDAARADAYAALGLWLESQWRRSLSAADAWRHAREIRGAVGDAEGEARALLAFAEEVLASGGIGAGIRAAFEDARIALRRAREKGSTSVDVALGLARAADAQGDPAAQLAELRAARAAHPDDPRPRRALAFALLNAGEHAAAVELFRPMSDEATEDPLLARALSYSALKAGDEDLARSAATRAIDAAPQSADAWRSLWSIYAPSKRYGELADQVVALAQKHAGSPTGAHYAGFACSSARRFDDALEWLAKAWELDEQNVSAALEAARVQLVEQRDRDAAAALYGAVLAKYPENPSAAQGIFVIANRHASAGDHEAALPYFRRLAELQPDVGTAQANYGLALRWAGRYDQADEAYRRAVDAAPDDAQLRNDYGLLLLVMRRDDDARATFLGAHEVDPLHNDCVENLGFMARERGDLADASQWFSVAWKAARRRGDEGQEARHRRNMDDARWPLPPVPER